MYPYRTLQFFAVLAVSCSFTSQTALVRIAVAAPTDVVDLEASPKATSPPSTATDAATPASPATGTDKAIRAEQEREAEGTAKLKLRAGEDGRGQSQVLGMSLKESGRERVKVVEVAMNSPAFDAGVMKGDEILYYQGFKGENYKKWIDGIRRLTTDTASGLSIPVVVSREGKQVTVQIRVPEKPVRASSTRPLPQPGSPLSPPEIGPALPVAGGPGGAAVNNVAVGDVGPFADFFAGKEASPNERAVAHLARLGGQPTPKPAAPTTDADSATTAPAPSAAPTNGGARIGLAGFRDDPSGMVVMVDVGTLPPGNYTVAITDASAIGGATLTPPQSPSAVPTDSGQVPNGAAPAPAVPGQRQGNAPPNTTNIPRTILAQVVAPGRPGTVDAIPPASAAGKPSETPAGNVGQSKGDLVNDGLGAAPTVNGTPTQIGTLTVDQSGTGRMQQKVEAMQVRNVVGQALVIFSQAGGSKTLPANLNGSAGSGSKPGVTDPIRAAQPAEAANTKTTSVATVAGSSEPTLGAEVPVAGGIIQLITDRRPPTTGGTQSAPSPAAASGTGEQPATATPPAAQKSVR